MIEEIKKAIWTTKERNRDMVDDWFGFTVQLTEKLCTRETNMCNVYNTGVKYSQITHLFVSYAYKDTFLENITYRVGFTKGKGSFFPP